MMTKASKIYFLALGMLLAPLTGHALTNNTVAPVVSQTTYSWDLTATDDTTYCSGGSPTLTRFVIVTEDTDAFTFDEHASVDFTSLPATLSWTPAFGDGWENVKLGCAAPDIYDRYVDFTTGTKYYNYYAPNADDRPPYIVTAFTTEPATSTATTTCEDACQLWTSTMNKGIVIFASTTPAWIGIVGVTFALGAAFAIMIGIFAAVSLPTRRGRNK